MSLAKGNTRSKSPSESDLNVAKVARRLVHQTNWASVATISGDPHCLGHPMVNLLPTADSKLGAKSTGEIFFYLLGIGNVARDVKMDKRISFMFTDAQMPECMKNCDDPWSLNCDRTVIFGQVKRLEEKSDEYIRGMEAFLSRHPSVVNWKNKPFPPNHEYYLCKLEISDVQAVTEFGFKHTSPKEYYAGSDKNSA